MSEYEIENKLMKWYNEMVAMRYAFGNIEEMADCDEPPKRGNDFSIIFKKNGEPCTCHIESKDWTRIYPKDLKPAIKCFKQPYQKKLNLEYEKYQQIKKGVTSLDALFSIIEEFSDSENI